MKNTVVCFHKFSKSIKLYEKQNNFLFKIYDASLNKKKNINFLFVFLTKIVLYFTLNAAWRPENLNSTLRF